MSGSRTPRASVGPSWKRISMHFAHLSTNFSLDATPDPSIPVNWPPTPLLTDTQNSSHVLRLRFRVKATAAFGSYIAVVGNVPELGQWNLDRKVSLITKSGDYPMWTSPEVVIPLSKVQVLEYKYVYIDRSNTFFWEKRIPNRKLDVRFSFTTKLTWTITDNFEEASQHTLDPKQRLPLLAGLSEDGSLYDHLQQLCAYFESRAGDANLQDYLTLAHLFEFWAKSGKETESKQSLDLMLRLNEVLQAHSTPEIEPVLRDIVLNMTKCSIPFWKVTNSILDRELVETSEVPLGCQSEELFEFLTDFLNVSSESDAVARLVILNSVRRCLRKLRQRSSTPDLIQMYDVCLEELAGTYIQDFEPYSGRLLTELHHITIVLESLELSSICTDECRAYCGALNAVWHAQTDVSRHWESIKGALLDLLRTFTMWLSKYSTARVVESAVDVLDLKGLLADIAARNAKKLFPSLADAIQQIDEDMRMAHYCPIKTGSASGKIIKIATLSEVPASPSPLIAIVAEVTDPEVRLPEGLQALILLKDVDLSSRVVSDCHARNIPVAIAAPSRIPENVESRAQVHIFEDSLEFA